ncbi:MAPK/MAK/MRK overlapping kinase-like isoform X2 [Physella acuta]|uniref:MAPK/MAK/MRK overlapping kinase-like isoform X2 n=1 Tax=Physella acuta TaxID=109671 RepID=UPI0027DB6FA6|nr:MAPK/MAK/MRK overlapping kinase-like isoform X2 [Physella acuta]
MNLLSQKYRILGKKGEGTFSEVLKVQVIKDGSYRACKKMKQTYESLEQVNNLREIQAMKRLAPHPNILELMEVVFDKKSGTLVLVCELMDMNIYELIRGRKEMLTDATVRNFMYQLTKSLDHLHRNGIFHRDVKPENILIKDDLLKLADFGSCRSIYSKKPYTEYISTRWYRAPECLLTDGYYGYKMDIWSVGCVFFEILSLHPLFPGSNEVDQIAKIHDVMGTPDPAVLNKLKRSKGMNFNFPPKKGTGIERLLTHAAPEAIELIYLMCTYDPEERITARQALKHLYFRDIRDAEKRAILQAKQMVPPEEAEPQPSVRDDNEISEKIIQFQQDPSSPLKTRMTEITMYPTLPKAQSHPTHPFKDRRRHKNKRTIESQNYSNHTGLLPRVPMHPATFNPTFHTSSFLTSYNKIPAGVTTQSLLPTINNSYKPHRSPLKTSKTLYNQYNLPSLDQQRY